MTPVCPFVKAAPPEEAKNCSLPDSDRKKESASVGNESSTTPTTGSVSPKCPFGYDSQTFKLGPLSCMICQALLFQCTKCIPCSHVFCKACVARFKDCPLCGADIEKVESDDNLQATVDKFIEGHARIRRGHVSPAKEANEKVIYEDVSLERGAFLVQQAMRAFRAQNVESAKSRLSVCAEDIRTQIDTTIDNTPELQSQLGAVLGMLGDCSRAGGDSLAAMEYFEESAEVLSKIPKGDKEITHSLSVTLNKVGDLKYYDGDLESAKTYYARSLALRQDAFKAKESTPSQAVDVAVSLAKVADVDRAIGNEDAAMEGFKEAIALLGSLTIQPENANIQQRRESVLEFLNKQIA